MKSHSEDNDRAVRCSDAMKACKSLDELSSCVEVLKGLIEKLPGELQEWLRCEYKSAKLSLESPTSPEDLELLEKGGEYDPKRKSPKRSEK